MYATIMAKLVLLFVLVVLNQHEVFQALRLSGPLSSHYKLYRADVEHLNRGNPSAAEPKASQQTTDQVSPGQPTSSSSLLPPFEVTTPATESKTQEDENMIKARASQLVHQRPVSGPTVEREAVKSIETLDNLDEYGGFERSGVHGPFRQTWRVEGWDFGHGYRYRKGRVNGLQSRTSLMTSIPRPNNNVLGHDSRDVLRSGTIVRPAYRGLEWAESVRKDVSNRIEDGHQDKRRESLERRHGRLTPGIPRFYADGATFVRSDEQDVGRIKITNKESPSPKADFISSRQPADTDLLLRHIFKLYGHIVPMYAEVNTTSLESSNDNGHFQANTTSMLGFRAVSEALKRNTDGQEAFVMRPRTESNMAMGSRLATVRPLQEPPTEFLSEDGVTMIRIDPGHHREVGPNQEVIRIGQPIASPLTIGRKETVHKAVNEHHFMFRVKGSYAKNKELLREMDALNSVKKSTSADGLRRFFEALERNQNARDKDPLEGKLRSSTAKYDMISTSSGYDKALNTAVDDDSYTHSSLSTANPELTEGGSASLAQGRHSDRKEKIEGEIEAGSADVIEQNLIVNKTIEAISRTNLWPQQMAQIQTKAEGHNLVDETKTARAEAILRVDRGRDEGTVSGGRVETLSILLQNEHLPEANIENISPSIYQTESWASSGTEYPNSGTEQMDAESRHQSDAYLGVHGAFENDAIKNNRNLFNKTEDKEYSGASTTVSLDRDVHGTESTSDVMNREENGSVLMTSTFSFGQDLEIPQTKGDKTSGELTNDTSDREQSRITTESVRQAVNETITTLTKDVWPYSKLTTAVVAGVLGSLSKQQFTWMDVIVAVTCTVAILMLLLNIGLLTQHFFQKRQGRLKFIQTGIGIPPTSHPDASLPDLGQQLDDNLQGTPPSDVGATVQQKNRPTAGRPNKIIHLDAPRVLHMDSGMSSLTSSGTSSGVSSGRTLSTLIQGDTVHGKDNVMARFIDDELIVSLNEHDSSCTSLSEGFIYCKDYGEVISSLDTTLQSHPLRKKPLWKRMCFSVDSQATAALYSETPALSETSSDRPLQDHI